MPVMVSDDSRRLQLHLAWANALRESVDAVRHFHTGTGDEVDLEWQVCIALAAGLATLARDGRRYGLSWTEISRLAAAEKLEIDVHYRHVASPGS